MWSKQQRICVGDPITLTLTGDIVDVGDGRGWHCNGTLKNGAPIHVVVTGIFTQAFPLGDWLRACVINGGNELIDPQFMPPERVLVARTIAPASDIYY